MGYTLPMDVFIRKLQKRIKLRGFSEQTKKSYCYHVKNFLLFLDKSRLNLNEEGVKSYLLSCDLSIKPIFLLIL